LRPLRLRGIYLTAKDAGVVAKVAKARVVCCAACGLINSAVLSRRGLVLMFQTNRRQLRGFLVAAAILFSLTAASAQSGDASYPTPVFTNDVSARIAPRDVGDPRRTRHFYTFRGTEVDLSVTFESSGLIGDVDVFTATTLRPLLKITLLGEASRVTKSFYIRSEEALVLRVEARSVGDQEGFYRIIFGGSFAPAPPELANATEPSTPTVKGSEQRGRGVRRVTSTGARIEEPVAEAPKEEATAEAKPTPSPSPSAATPARRGARAATRRGAGTRPGARRTRAGATPQPGAAKAETNETKPAATKASAKPSDETKPEAEATTTATPKPAPSRRAARTPRRRAPRASAESARTETATQPSNGTQPAAPPTTPAPTQRLIIITKDGEMIVRDMNSVRRVTVENNQVVVITKDGKIIRQPMANVVRMSIEP